jgi:2-hydroxy-3-keto-5-methylthiopentenyl-1-phosphate phosphatase
MTTHPVPVPSLEPGDPPIAFLVDYDGTIAVTDVSDALMAEFVTEAWERKAAEYDAGLIGSRRLMEWEVGLIHADPERLRATAAAQPHDPGFRRFAERAAAARIPVEVVSDGFGFFIPAALDALGVPDIPVISADTTFADGRAAIHFPNGNPRCYVCGTCKRNRVLAHQAAGRAVVFIGDGPSDRYAAAHADVVFAKHALVEIALEHGWPFERWTAFVEIEAWLARRLAAWPGDPSVFPRPVARPLGCGPELWGEGRWDPPPPGDPRRGIAGMQDEGVAPG